MKIDLSSLLDNRAYQFAAVGAICLGLVGFALAQDSCGKHHEEAAIVAGAKADASAERLKDALQQIDGLNRKVADLEEAGRRYRTLYLQARNHVPPPPQPPPQDRVELARALESQGIDKGAVVTVGIPFTTFTEHDAGLVYTVSERAKRAEALESALKACDELQAQQQVEIESRKALQEQTAAALRVSMEEAMHRQEQATALGKALAVEKRKGWQRVGAFGLGVLGGYLAGKK